MERYQTISQVVGGYLDELEASAEEGRTLEELEELKIVRQGVDLVVDAVITSRETLTDDSFGPIERAIARNREAVSVLLDARYTRDAIKAVPGYVSRTMQLSRIEGSRIPSKVTNVYLREAARTYVFGLPQATIALCRAAMEQALKEELGHQGKQIFLDMNDLLDESEGAGVIDFVVRKMARKIASEADAVLHEKPADLTKAYEVLVLLRGVLQHVYAE